MTSADELQLLEDAEAAEDPALEADDDVAGADVGFVLLEDDVADEPYDPDDDLGALEADDVDDDELEGIA